MMPGNEVVEKRESGRAAAEPTNEAVTSPEKSLAQEAYEAWDREASEHVGSMPPWHGLPNGIKNAWNAALERAFELRDEREQLRAAAGLIRP